MKGDRPYFVAYLNCLTGLSYHTLPVESLVVKYHTIISLLHLKVWPTS